MSDAYPSAPKNLRSLRDRLAHVSRRDGVVFGRLQQHIGVLVVSQFMGSLTDEHGQPHLLIKGGSALELRRGIAQSRASRDLDAVTRHDLDAVWQSLWEAAAQGWEGFTGVLTEPEVINVPGLLVKPRRFIVKLKYQGASFVSVPVEVSPAGRSDALAGHTPEPRTPPGRRTVRLSAGVPDQCDRGTPSSPQANPKGRRNSDGRWRPRRSARWGRPFKARLIFSPEQESWRFVVRGKIRGCPDWIDVHSSPLPSQVRSGLARDCSWDDDGVDRAPMNWRRRTSRSPEPPQGR